MTLEPPPVATPSSPTAEVASTDANNTAGSSVTASDLVTHETGRISTEIVEVEAESFRPPPPRSLRLKSAKDSTSQPLAITAQLPSPVWPPKTVADLMIRKIITVDELEPIGKLEEWMQHFRFRHLPVLDATRKLVGLISRTDLLHAELGRKPDGSEATAPVDGATPAGTIMRRDVVVAQLDTPLATACSVMLDNRLTCLPVVLEDHTLVGILTETDFIRCTRDLLMIQA